MNKFQKRSASLFASILSVIIALGLVINLVWPDRAKSSVENRPLAQLEMPKAETIADDSWQKSVTDWFSDQFVGRDLFFRIHYLFAKAAGLHEIDDVYLAKGSLIQQAPEPRLDLLDRKATDINSFYAAYPIHTMSAVVPTAAWTQKDRLPAFAQNEDQATIISSFQEKLDPNIVKLDLTAPLEQVKDEYIYYRTDHHWTSLGAWQAAKAVLDSCGIPAELSDFEKLPVSNSFEGTLESKTGSIGLRDTIDIYKANSLPDYLVERSDGTVSTSIYNLEALSQKDQYEVFLGKNEALVKVTTTNASSRNLLIFKDSYANSMIQFLLPYFHSITIVDPRYYYDDINRTIESSMITDILYLYNYSNFASDASLMEVLESGLVPAESENPEE